jgi:pimeloyl-ACP methyl ester carboxylesterase
MRKFWIGTACRLAPALLADFAYRQFTHPPAQKLPPAERDVLDTAEKTIVPFRDFRIQTYRWAGPGKRLVLVHGWEGRAGNFISLLPLLQTAGFDVYAFDAPSHGLSSRGATSMFEFSDLVAERLQDWQPEYAISHSFGSVATISALSSNPALSLKKYALLTTPDRFLERIDWVAAQVGITEGVKKRLIRRIQREMGIDPAAMNVSDAAAHTRVEQALILHDVRDRVIPIQQARNVHAHWPSSQLQELEHTGHFKILRDPGVRECLHAFFLS